jgi:hypothetical protein
LQNLPSAELSDVANIARSIVISQEIEVIVSGISDAFMLSYAENHFVSRSAGVAEVDESG